MSTVNDTDLLLVNRGGQSYNVKIEDMSTVEDTDLLLINRGGQSFKVEAKDLPGGETTTAPVINHVDLAQLSGDRFDNGVFSNAIIYDNQGSLENQISMNAAVYGNFLQVGHTSPVTAVSTVTSPQYGDPSASSSGASLYDFKPYLAGLGVTGITGMRLGGPENTAYTTSVSQMFINGVNMDTIYREVRNVVGIVYSSEAYSFQNFLSGTGTGSAIQGSTGPGNIVYSAEWDEIPIGDAWTVTYNLYSALFGMNLMCRDQRGVWINMVGDPLPASSSSVLTFQDNTDLNNGLFLPGDIVTKDGGGTVEMVPGSPANEDPTNIGYVWHCFDGDLVSYGVTMSMTFSPPLEGKLEIYPSGGVFYHVNNADSYITCPDATWTTLSETGPVASLQSDQGNGNLGAASVSAFRLDGEVIVFNPNIIVDGVDGDNNQMSLQGGTWDVGDEVVNTVPHTVLESPQTSTIVSGDYVEETGDPSAPVNGSNTVDYDFGPYLVSKGVTAITGFRLEGEFNATYNYTSLLFDMSVDGDTLRNMVRTPENVVGTYYAAQEFSFEYYFSGNAGPGTQIGGATTAELQEYSCTLSAPIPFSNSFIASYYNYGTGTEPRPDFKAMILDQNGKWIPLFGDILVKQVTFADNTNLTSFTPGLAITQDAPVTAVTSEITDVSGTTLTFQDNTGLGNFLPGDAITPEAVTTSVVLKPIGSVGSFDVYGDGNNLTGSLTAPAATDLLMQQSYWNNNLNDSAKIQGSGNVGLYTGSYSFEYTVPNAGDKLQFVIGAAQINGVGGLNFTGDCVETSYVTTNGAKTSLPKDLMELTTTQTSGTITWDGGQSIFLYWWANAANTTGPVVVSTDLAANQMVVSDGTYQIGETVTGITIDGSGTCQGVDIPTVTMDVSDRFAIGSKINGALAPSSSVKNWLVIDQNGNVSSISPDDTGYTIQTSQNPTVTFPGTMSTGQAPNSELPPGTSIQTKILASNSAGSDIKESNRFTPTGSDAVFLDHCPTEAQLLACHQAQQFMFHSYDEREKVKTYQDISAKLAEYQTEITDLEELYDQS